MEGVRVGGTKVVYCFYQANLLYMSRAILAHHKSMAISRMQHVLEDRETGVAGVEGSTFIDGFMGVEGVFAFSILKHLSQICPPPPSWRGPQKMSTVRRNPEEAV